MNIKLKCRNCCGTGKVDDSDFGDIWFRVFKCSTCDGKGYIKELFNPNQIYEEIK
jgi:DnaJ-class molecular chaperone